MAFASNLDKSPEFDIEMEFPDETGLGENSSSGKYIKKTKSKNMEKRAFTSQSYSSNSAGNPYLAKTTN